MPNNCLLVCTLYGFECLSTTGSFFPIYFVEDVSFYMFSLN